MLKFTKQEQNILSYLQGNIPISKEPFADIAKELSIDEDDLIKTIQNWKEQGIIRRFGAVLQHHKAGMKANAMSVWEVPEDKIEAAAAIICNYPQITHCYERKTYPEWTYNIYAMIHGKSKKECEDIAREISKKTDIKNYCLLYSDKEYKKESFKFKF